MLMTKIYLATVLICFLGIFLVSRAFGKSYRKTGYKSIVGKKTVGKRISAYTKLIIIVITPVFNVIFMLMILVLAEEFYDNIRDSSYVKEDLPKETNNCSTINLGPSEIYDYERW